MEGGAANHFRSVGVGRRPSRRIRDLHVAVDVGIYAAGNDQQAIRGNGTGCRGLGSQVGGQGHNLPVPNADVEDRRPAGGYRQPAFDNEVEHRSSPFGSSVRGWRPGGSARCAHARADSTGTNLFRAGASSKSIAACNCGSMIRAGRCSLGEGERCRPPLSQVAVSTTAG